ncbi:integral membrane sensor signal transduction histidine kinase [Ruegeria lacuscaerulensis ITI-1157]|nr:integral membrane sensor signal transduction histidine kinase [Ruegeria lacuscaerulensis ITI-1157]SHJ36513.1 two-component system, OmpR family, sensor histidine kinase TctE [Ruegeria lacuscaerulensis ITI-1157]
MKAGVLSLRLRLFLLILAPLVVMAVVLGLWRYSAAQRTAEELFDRSLLAAALALSRDVAVTGGDAVSPTTRDLVLNAAGGEVFYHATGPGGIYVTGYAYPPVRAGTAAPELNTPVYFQSNYRGDPVRVLQLSESVTVGDLTGPSTITVWQRLHDRQVFADRLAVRAAVLMGGLLATLCVVVWFGVRLGLRPLTDLHDAIGMRSSEDLSPIRRPVPAEVRGIVDTLNRLFRQVESSMQAQRTFISDAAHQLRNPAAAVLSLTEAVRAARTEADRDERLAELAAAARGNARVAEQLLSLDRLQRPGTADAAETIDLAGLVREICTEAGPSLLRAGIEFELEVGNAPLWVTGDAVFLAEAIKNLIDNAVKHGGPELGLIRVTVGRRDARAMVTVYDDGAPLSPRDEAIAFSRFGQISPSGGSGLGLAIVASVAERHGGTLHIDDVAKGASLSLALPVSEESEKRMLPRKTD